MSHTWNNRCIRRWHEPSKQYFYGIVEVYYQGEAIVGWTQEFMKADGETLAELKEDLERYLRALTYPILDEKMVDGKEVLVPITDTPKE